MIVITGATGQLGRLVITELLKTVPASDIVAAVRTPAKAADLAALGVQVREADYNRPDTLKSAFAGADKLLLVSGNELGQRSTQHQAVIDAARQAGVKLLAYTSLLHADTTDLALRHEHLATEAAIKASGLPGVILRNGWYNENYLMALAPALQHGAMIGSAGEGRIASASRADYAAAAAVVLSTEGHAGKVYELAGDSAYTLAELAAEISRQSGTKVVYNNLAQADYKAALAGAGVPEEFADLLADSDIGASKGGLFDDSRTLGKLIGRPTTPVAQSVTVALAALK